MVFQSKKPPPLNKLLKIVVLTMSSLVLLSGGGADIETPEIPGGIDERRYEPVAV